MKFDLKQTCPECPYVAKTQGWIGGHETAKDFHNLVLADQDFPCHMSQKQHCVGNALYMNKMCKVSHNPDKAEFQKILKRKQH